MPTSVADAVPQVDAALQLTLTRFTPACTRCVKPTCCWQRVLAYGSEARAIADAIHDNEPLKENLRQWVRTFLTLRRDEQMYADRYFTLRRKCPFLVAGKCAVYEQRPVACRVHFSLEETPDLCDPDLNPEGRMLKQLDTLQLHTQLHQLEPNTYLLGLAVLYLLEPDTVLGKQARALDEFLYRELLATTEVG